MNEFPYIDLNGDRFRVRLSKEFCDSYDFQYDDWPDWFTIPLSDLEHPTHLHHSVREEIFGVIEVVK
jgi:hypothetical protein